MGIAFKDLIKEKLNGFVIIAGVHFMALPGSPGHDPSIGLKGIIKRAQNDAMILLDHGVDSLLFTNESDTPYITMLKPETIAAFSVAVSEITVSINVPFGVNVLLDTVAGFSIAHATRAEFVRGYFSGTYITDVGYMNTQGPQALLLRAQLQAQHIMAIDNLVCAFGEPLVKRPIEDKAYGAKIHSGVDGFTISGSAAGHPPIPEQFIRVRERTGNFPIIVGTGVSTENIREFSEVADGAIVVTRLRDEDKTLNPVDPARVKKFMTAVKEIKEL